MKWRILHCMLVAVAAFAVMQATQQYIFYAKEAEHLWLNDWLWVHPQLLQPGGTVQLLTSLCTQFFRFRGVGAGVTAMVMAGVFACGWRLQRRMGVGDRFDPLWLLTVVLMVLCNEHTYYNLRGHSALLTALVAACLYIRRRSWLTAVVAVVATYWIAGSAAVVTVAAIVVHDVVVARRYGTAVLAPAILVVEAIVCVRARYYIGMEEALTPLQYYEWPSTYFFPSYAWASVPCILIAGRLCGRLTARHAMLTVGVCTALPVVAWWRMYGAVHSEQIYLLRQDEWHARCGDWDAIIASHRGKPYPTAFISYLNLALAQRGQLVQRMGEFRPYIISDGERSMPVLLAQHELSRDALKLQSCVFMHWGGAALANAQKSAFEANLLTPGDSDPVELQRLVATNRLFDTPRAAEKYQRRLDRTTFYRGAEMNVEGLALPAEDGFYMKTQVGRMLRQIAMESPENRIATQFYEAYLIQSRDTVAYRHWKGFEKERRAAQ